MPDHQYVPLQPWSCDKCAWHGDIEVPIGTDVWSLYQMIRGAHREASHECHHKWGVQYVRVNPAGVPLLP